MISTSFPEPKSDIAGQIDALCSLYRPKCSMWIAAGTAAPAIPAGMFCVAHEAGVFVSVDLGVARQFQADPCDTQLARLLGYPEAKSELVGFPVVVQSRDGADRVIFEALCSEHRVDETMAAAEAHGVPRIVSIGEALVRRAMLSRQDRN